MENVDIAENEMILKIGVVTSRFNSEVTDKLEKGALQVLEEAGVEIFAVRVPGAIEIPLAVKGLLDAGCDGVVALGAVIRGETSHYDYVCNSVERGISQLMLDYGKPVSFGVLTTENEEQAFDRVGGKHGHKGQEAAQVALEMVGLMFEMEALKLELIAEESFEEAGQEMMYINSLAELNAVKSKKTKKKAPTKKASKKSTSKSRKAQLKKIKK